MKKNNLVASILTISLFASVTQIFFCCNNSPSNSSNKSNKQPKTSVVNRFILKPSSSFSDTLIIKVPAAVFYNPDSAQLKKIEAVNKKMIFESLKHDCFYQMRNAKRVLKEYWPRVRIIETSKARYLEFVKTDNRKVYIDLNAKNDMCGLFLFDRKKDPELADMMNIDTDLGFYFKK